MTDYGLLYMLIGVCLLLGCRNKHVFRTLRLLHCTFQLLSELGFYDRLCHRES